MMAAYDSEGSGALNFWDFVTMIVEPKHSDIFQFALTNEVRVGEPMALVSIIDTIAAIA